MLTYEKSLKVALEHGKWKKHKSIVNFLFWRQRGILCSFNCLISKVKGTDRCQSQKMRQSTTSLSTKKQHIVDLFSRSLFRGSIEILRPIQLTCRCKMLICI